MEEPPTTQPQPIAPGRTTSWWARMTNVLVAPGEVFDEIKSSRPNTANWLGPALVYATAGVLAATLILSQPAIIQKLHEQQAKAFDEKFKNTPPEEAARARAIAEKFSTPAMARTFGSIGAVVASFGEIFVWAFLLWLIARFCLKSKVELMKAVEVSGLAASVGVLETLVRMLIAVNLSNPYATPSLALLIKTGPQQKMLAAALSLVNPLIFWLLAVRSIGLAKITGVSTGKAAVWVFLAWALLAGTFNLALQAAFQK